MLLTLLLFPLASAALCPDTTTCLTRVREIAAGPRRFWFGEQRKAMCHQRHASPIECWNPSHLSPFHSLGQRLFRVRTYHSAYLKNLRVFPRVTFRVVPGSYHACDHDYTIGNETALIEADPYMQPAHPFMIRKRPDIVWHGLEYDGEYTILIVDVGFGTLNYAVTGWPKEKKVLLDYSPSDNFRPSANPMVVLVFEKAAEEIQLDVTNFDLSKFMLQNELTDGLIGMSLILVSGDPYAIERQRVRGTVDNCHSLLTRKMFLEDPVPVLSKLPLDECNAWMSVEYNQPGVDGNVCCRKVDLSQGPLRLDPLSSSPISALSVLSPPEVSSLRPPTQTHYHRTARTFVALLNELYSLVLLDGETGRLYWIVVDIPASRLADDVRDSGITKLSYSAPVPSNPTECRTLGWTLFSQQGSLGGIQGICNECKERDEFSVTSFKQRYSLRLSAVSWMRVCYDLPYAFHVIRTQHKNNTERRDGPLRLSASPLSKSICSSFDVSPHHNCPLVSESTVATLWVTVLITLVTLIR